MLRKKSGGGSRIIEIGGAKEAPSRAGWLPPDAKGPRAPRFFFATRGCTLEWYLTAHGATPAGTLDLREIRGMTPTDAAVLELKFDRPSAGGATSTMCVDFGYMGERNAWLHVWAPHVDPDALPDDYDEKPMKI